MVDNGGPIDSALIGALSVALIWVGSRFGLGWVAVLGEFLAKLKPADKPKPAEPEKALGENVEFVALRGKPVALPAFLAFLLTFLPYLIPLVEKALAALAERLGREPKPEEVKEVVLDVVRNNVSK